MFGRKCGECMVKNGKNRQRTGCSLFSLKLILLIFGVLFFSVFACCSAAWAAAESSGAAETEFSAAAVADLLDFSALDDELSYVESFFAENYGSFDLSAFWQQLKSGSLDLDFADFWQMLTDLFFGDLKSCLVIFSQLLVLIIISALLANFDNSFGGGSAYLGGKIIYIVLLAVALEAFVICGKSVGGAVDLMSGFFYAIVPILLTLFVAMGGATAVGIFHPLLMFAVAASVNIINFFVLPLTYCCAALTAAGSLNRDFSLGNLRGLLKSAALWVLTLLLSLFTAVIGIVGLGSAAADGLAMKTAKSAVGMFVPVVGRSIGDLLGTLTGTALLLKNCLGIGGILLIIAICLAPAVKALVMAWLFRLGGALAEPLGDKQLASAMSGLGNVLTMLFAVVAACGIFFFFLLAITLAMGNLNMAIA